MCTRCVLLLFNVPIFYWKILLVYEQKVKKELECKLHTIYIFSIELFATST